MRSSKMVKHLYLVNISDGVAGIWLLVLSIIGYDKVILSMELTTTTG
ncbi:hypothetical protein HMPREF9104_00673 [Lentilactobacillus kisonensis F0435]|uniref:Uncharacterized protein n=1 Tax=Lentilactobacillus kisonensis F0435 TaxID=797516 RepID=H1LDJ8_9LACO|nr:hypothetical protein HMPREF9104_00673 [Lentilactobacillus kisonensis F0435]